jgi:hypothetical protein
MVFCYKFSHGFYVDYNIDLTKKSIIKLKVSPIFLKNAHTVYFRRHLFNVHPIFFPDIFCDYHFPLIESY